MKLREAAVLRKRHKYGVAPKADRTLDNIVFDSKREMQRYAELKMLQKAHVISELFLQPKFPIVIEATYVADFQYLDGAGKLVVEDVKGFKTREYLRKKKQVEKQYKITIVEVK